ncbi:M48 family metalloprotease, partial [Streptococcus pyogenes]
LAANLGTQLLALKFSRSDETEADLVGLDLAARSAFAPDAAVSLWRKMGEAQGGRNNIAFLSTHPSGPDRIRQLERNIP